MVEFRGGRVFVKGKKDRSKKWKVGKSDADEPKRIVIAGGGCWVLSRGDAAAAKVRRRQHDAER
jgi:hypothetical protein